ncbi:hypothetical protein EON80_06155 [bacterium]|nr:MAG: hypothetical protein EON80_06155 [bacterium]
MKTLANGIVQFTIQTALWFFMPFLAGACFVIFDALHVTSTWLQITIVIAPLIGLAFSLWRREQAEQRKEMTAKLKDQPILRNNKI